MSGTEEWGRQMGAVASLLAQAGTPLELRELMPAFDGLDVKQAGNRVAAFSRRGWLAIAPRRKIANASRRFVLGPVGGWQHGGKFSPVHNRPSLEAAVRMVAFALSVPKSSPKLTTTDDFDHALVAIGGAWDAAVHELGVALDVDDRLAGIREQFAEVAA